MALPWLAVATKAVPWDKILVHGPKILDAARKLYEAITNSRRPEPAKTPSDEPVGQIQEFRASLNRFEENQLQQATVIRDIASQLEASSSAFEVLRVRVAIALAVALVALIVAILSVVRTLGW